MLRPLLGLAIILGAMVLLAGAFNEIHEDRSKDELPDAAADELARYLSRMSPEDAEKLLELWDDLSPEQQDQLLDALRRLDDQELSDLVDVFEDLSPDQQADLLDIMEDVAGRRDLDRLSRDDQAALQGMMDRLDQGDATALAGLLSTISRDSASDLLRSRESKPFGAQDAGGLTGKTNGDPVPSPGDPGIVRPDRRGESDVTCYAIFDPYLACAKRWQVLDQIDGEYRLSASSSDWQPVSTSFASGTRYDATFPIMVEAGEVTPIFSVAPGQAVRFFDAKGPGSAELVKDGRDVYGVRGDVDGEYQVAIIVMDDTAYRDGIPLVDRAALPAIPAQDLPVVAQWLQDNGLWQRDDVGQALRELQAIFQSYEGGKPLSAAQQPDFFLSVVEAEEGCCRHFATAFMAAATSMGVETRVVYNEGHMFAEVRMPAGWVEVQLGGCGGYEIEGARNKSPDAGASGTNGQLVADGDGRTQVAVDTVATRTSITGYSDRIEKGEPFTVSGRVTAGGDGLGDAPVRLYANQTKFAPGTLLGSTRTTASGDWTIDATFPSNLPAGDYQLVAEHTGTSRDEIYARSWSDPPFTVHSAAELIPAVPAYGPADGPTAVAVRLVDQDGVGVPGERVTLALGNQSLATFTDDNGRASFSVAAPSTGGHTIQFDYAGSDHLDPATASAEIRFVDVVFTPDAATPIRVTPGQEWALTGTVTSGGAPLADTRFEAIGPDSESATVSGPDGRVTFALDGGAGQYWLDIIGPTSRVASLEVWGQQAVQVDAVSNQYARDGRAAIIVQWSGSDIIEGQPIRTDAGVVWTDAGGRAEVLASGRTAISWTETPLITGGSVEIATEALTLAPGEGRLDGDTLTVPFGVANVRAPSPATLRVGEATITGTWDEGGLTFQLEDAALGETLAIDTGFPGHTVTTTYSTVASQPFEAPWWIIPIIVAAAGIGVVLWLLKSGKIQLARPAPRIVISAQGRPAGMPLVAAPGQPWQIRIRCFAPSSRDPVPGRIRWRIGEHAGQAVGEDVTIDLPAQPDGTHAFKVRIRASGLGSTKIEATLRVGSWDEHLAHAFQLLEHKAQERTGKDGLTPRMVVAALPHRGPDLVDAIRIYEGMAFGNEAVDQEAWERFARAARPGVPGAN